MNHNEAVKAVAKILADGNRSDRYLRVTDDGDYFTTPDYTFLTSDGVETPVSVKIPVSESDSEEENEVWADALIRELDREVFRK